MGSRFGRNKRRRLRQVEAENADLRTAYAQTAALLKDTSRKLDGLRNDVDKWDMEIRRLLGNQSAFRKDPPLIEAGAPIRDWPVRQASWTLPFDDMAYGMILDRTFMQVRMRRYVTIIERNMEYCQTLVRFVETNERKEAVAYSISENMRLMGFGPRDMEFVSEVIAKKIGEHLRGKAG